MLPHRFGRGAPSRCSRGRATRALPYHSIYYGLLQSRSGKIYPSMADPEQTKTTDERKKPEQEGCPIQMFNLRRCGRPIYEPAPGHRDGIPVCLMHSRDPQKSNIKFQEEFERTLAVPDDGIANFSGFVFPSANYRKYLFRAKCIFNRATFIGPADFSGATFTEVAIFSEAVFLQQAIFPASRFMKDAVFAWATFAHGADFRVVQVMQEARFHEATFA